MNPDFLYRIRGIGKTFPDGTEALGHIDLDLFPSQFVIIAGSNGSGKTVLMRLLVGLMDPSRGTILYQGEDIRKQRALIRRSVGLVFQDPDAQILGETVGEDTAFGPRNLDLPEGEVERRVTEALTAVGLGEKKDSPPRRLSGGEKRRLAVAGVLAMGCGTVILDEPFANLDWPGVLQVLQILRDLKQRGKTVILLTHELEKVLALADRLVILHRGKIEADGPSEKVLETLDPQWGVRDPRRGYPTVKDCTWLP